MVTNLMKALKVVLTAVVALDAGHASVLYDEAIARQDFAAADRHAGRTLDAGAALRGIWP